MFEIKFGDHGEIVPVGRLDASQIDQARDFFEGVTTSKTIDLTRLEYISSVGIGLLASTQKRLSLSGKKLKLVNAQDQIKEVFRVVGLDGIFEME